MKEVIMKVPSFSADYPKAPIYVAELVRCKECKHWDTKWIPSGENDDVHWCSWKDLVEHGDWFCADGERKEGE